jgi:hypothetical protein
MQLSIRIRKFNQKEKTKRKHIAEKGGREGLEEMVRVVIAAKVLRKREREYTISSRDISQSKGNSFYDDIIYRNFQIMLLCMC